MKPRYFVIADIHGEYEKLEAVIKLITEKANFSLEKGDILVQLGDRNDRGHDTYKVNEYFKTQQLMFPGQVHVVMGNHDRMLIDAVEGRSDLMYFNGGNKTLTSYCRELGLYGKGHLARAVQKTGHYDWLKRCPLYVETDDYFFCHAPIPKDQYSSLPIGADFRTDEHTLTWTYVHGLPEEKWVNPNPVPVERDGVFYDNEGKTAVYGHIHGLYMGETGRGRGIIVPGVRVYGNAILLDTGSGCADAGYLSCLELPARNVYTSKGEVYNLDEQETAKALKRLEEKAAAEELKKKIPDDKVDF
jgi:diadenosine tetraphosphatase ApaH/serine/threonine PP2A family protein phosphatase